MHHLILLLYFILDYQLYKVIVDIDKETSSSMVKKYCQNFQSIIGEKLWPYCGSSLAVSAAFLTGVDISAKIEDMVTSVTQKKRNVDINGRVSFFKSVVATVISFMKVWFDDLWFGVSNFYRDCNAVYVGETGRSVRTRKLEHADAVKTFNTKKSALSQHVMDFDHRIHWDNVKILKSESHAYRRRVAESF